MFGIGGFELFLILIFGFLIFGPDKLPEIAKTIGRAIAKFRGAQESMTEQLKDVTLIDKDSDKPLKNPLDVLNSVTSKESSKGKEASKEKNSPPKDSAETESKASSDRPSTDAEAKRADSFAERKARYDRERAARKQAEAQAAKEAEAKAAAEEKARKEAADNPKMDIAAKTLKEEGE